MPQYFWKYRTEEYQLFKEKELTRHRIELGRDERGVIVPYKTKFYISPAEEKELVVRCLDEGQGMFMFDRIVLKLLMTNSHDIGTAGGITIIPSCSSGLTKTIEREYLNFIKDPRAQKAIIQVEKLLLRQSDLDS